MAEHPDQHGRQADGTAEVSAEVSATALALFAASLADGRSTLLHATVDEPVRLLIRGLRQLGVTVLENESTGHMEVAGHGGLWVHADLELDCGRQPTATNLLLAACTLGHGRYRIKGATIGSPSVQSLMNALIDLGLRLHIEDDPTEPTIQIAPSLFRGGRTAVVDPDAADAVSSLLLVAPCAAGDIFIEAPQWPSRPVGVGIALSILDKFGVAVIDDLGNRLIVPAPQAYAAAECDLAAWETPPL